MIPNLGRLSVHDVVNTMGFYELTDEERQQLDDDDVNDPVSMERPVHTMTFRVRLADDGPNGEPRYKYFSPHQLWRWVSENNSLPAREGPIWYEDWWALCNTYNRTTTTSRRGRTGSSTAASTWPSGRASGRRRSSRRRGQMRGRLERANRARKHRHRHRQRQRRRACPDFGPARSAWVRSGPPTICRSGYFGSSPPVMPPPSLD